jgi:putative ABC transport system permease protein
MRFQDTRYALRTLWHNKGFATVAILCLGFGIGLNATIFSIVDGVILQPYPYTDPDRILVIGARHQQTRDTTGLSFLDMRDWKEANGGVLTTIAATQGRALTVSDGTGEPERHLGAAISWDLFPLLGITPSLGRGFTAEDDQPNAAGVVILSDALWTRRYRADPNILGRTILVDAKPYVVIGVMPPRFEFPENQRLWIPLAPSAFKDRRDARNLFAFGRMKPGATRASTLDALDAAAAHLSQQYPTTNEGWRAHVRTLRDAFLPDEVTLVIYLMMSGVTLVLFIACSNVANLLVARAAWRRREFAVRAAIGAGRGRIIRQLLTESIVLGLASVPLGIALAQIGTRMIAAAIPVDQIPYYVQWRVDWRTLLYTIGIAFATSLVFGLFPALQVSRGDLHESLKEGTRGNSGSRSWLRSGLVVAQVALALVALVGALLFVRTFLNLESSKLGFDTRALMTLRFYMAGAPYEPDGAKSRRAEDIVRRVEALSGVQAAFASNLIPISGGGGGGPVEIDGRAVERRERANIAFIGVTPHFHKTLGVSILRGRDFTDAEGWSRTPVAIINQTMATRYWPDVDALDRRFRLASADGSGDWFRVIGVAPDLHLFGIDPSDTEPTPSAFVPYAYQQTLSTGLTIRVAGDPSSITSAARAQIRASDPNISTYWVRTLDDVRRMEFWEYGLYGWIFGTTGVVGLLLAAVGVYGVLSYSVSQRTQEIGIRVALGAHRGDVVRLVLGQALLLAGMGVVIGLAMAAFGMPLTRQLLYNVSPFDPLSFSLVSAFLVLVALMASYLPARHAARVDPVIALRGE